MADSLNWLLKTPRKENENHDVLEPSPGFPPRPRFGVQTYTATPPPINTSAKFGGDLQVKEDQNPNFCTPITNPRQEIIAKFESFVRSLDDCFPQPDRINPAFLLHHYEPTSPPSIDFSDAWKRLSSLLPLGVHTITDSAKITELLDLATHLKEDASLNSDQRSLPEAIIEEVPRLSKGALQVKETAEQVKDFTASLESNQSKARLLSQEYNDMRKAVLCLGAERDANACAIRETDEQIRRLQRRRFELARIGEMKSNAMAEMDSSLKKMKEKMSDVGGEIRDSNASKEELEAKKMYLCNDIVARVATLNSFGQIF